MSIMLIGLPGGMEWVIILIAILLLFGGRKIPELMRGLGKGIREFNSARANVKEEIEKGMKDDEKPAKSADSDSQTEAKS